LSLIDWAVQNQKLDALQFFLENYEVDVLQKNSFGRSILTDAFQSSNTDVIAMCLNHSSSTEERLLSVDQKENFKVSNESKGDEAEGGAEGEEKGDSNEVIHEFDFSLDSLEESDSPSKERVLLKVRELPITRADHPFGSETAPEDDTTGLGIWPASLLMARYAVGARELLKDKIVVELGCGCGVPGLAAGKSDLFFASILIFFLKLGIVNPREFISQISINLLLTICLSILHSMVFLLLHLTKLLQLFLSLLIGVIPPLILQNRPIS
jgi:hypothetical protein